MKLTVDQALHSALDTPQIQDFADQLVTALRVLGMNPADTSLVLVWALATTIRRAAFQTATTDVDCVAIVGEALAGALAAIPPREEPRIWTPGTGGVA